MFEGNQDRVALLAAYAKPMQQADEEQRQRRGDADRLIGWHEPDDEGRDADDQEGGDERDLAAAPVADDAEHQAADRPGDKSCRIGAERDERTDKGIEARKEKLVEHERGRGRVDEEVVPLDRGADA